MLSMFCTASIAMLCCTSAQESSALLPRIGHTLYVLYCKYCDALLYLFLNLPNVQVIHF